MSAAAPARPLNAKQQAIEALAGMVRSADTEEAALAAVEKHCKARMEAGTTDAALRTYLTAANKKLEAEGDKLAGHCRYPALQTTLNNAQKAKRDASRESTDGALLQIDLDVEIFPTCLEVLQLNKAKASHLGSKRLTQPMVGVAVLGMTGRRRGGVVDGRARAPVWDFSDDDQTATMSFLLKQGQQAPHTFPVLCDPELLEYALTTVRAYFKDKIKTDVAPGEDALKNIGDQLNRAAKQLFPAVAKAWVNFFKPREGEKGFTVHALRSFYGAKLWSIRNTSGGIYLAQLKIWLGHFSEDSSKYYEKVMHVKGHVLDSAESEAFRRRSASTAAESEAFRRSSAEPVTEEAFISSMLARVSGSQQLLKPDRKRKLRSCLTGMIAEIGEEEEKAAREEARQPKQQRSRRLDFD